MSKSEMLKTWFYPIPALRIGGNIMPAPEKTVKRYRNLKNRWLKKYPNLPDEIPQIRLYPGTKKEKEGYYVETIIKHRERS